MITALDDLSVLQHHDGVGVPHGGEPVGDDKGGPVRHEPVHAPLDVLLRPGIHGACGLVQDQDGSPGDRRPGDI